MPRRIVAMASIIATLALAAPALAQTAPAATGQTVTATGSSETKVSPKNRHNNASIAAAVEAAQKAGIAGAISDAKEYAQKYASALGLTLGSVISVTDVNNNNGGYVGQFFGPFGPNQFCGTVRQGVIKKVRGKRKVVRTKKVHRCFVPSFETTTLTITYSATTTTA